MGVEPTYAAWEAAVLPMNYSRMSGSHYNRPFEKLQPEKCRVPARLHFITLSLRPLTVLCYHGPRAKLKNGRYPL